MIIRQCKLHLWVTPIIVYAPFDNKSEQNYISAQL